jgi:hypothetical protein
MYIIYHFTKISHRVCTSHTISQKNKPWLEPRHPLLTKDSIWIFLPAIAPITPSAIGPIIATTQHHNKHNTAIDITLPSIHILQLYQRFHQVRMDTFILLFWPLRALLFCWWRSLELTFDAVNDFIILFDGWKHTRCRVATSVLSCRRSRSRFVDDMIGLDDRRLLPLSTDAFLSWCYRFGDAYQCEARASAVDYHQPNT